VQLLLHRLEPIICIHQLDRVRESRWLGVMKVSKSVPHRWWWCLVLSILHVNHGLLHSLKHLSLQHQNLLQGRWGWVGSVVVLSVGITVPCVGHLKSRWDKQERGGGERTKRFLTKILLYDPKGCVCKIYLTFTLALKQKCKSNIWSSRKEQSILT
jgi:hypothetical protein